jgi:MYXO-CTERM domain-containing protein
MFPIRRILSSSLAASLLVLLLPAKATAAPGAFDIFSPANGAWCAATCAFTWQSAASATSYDLYIDDALKKAAIAPGVSPSYALAAGESITDGWHTWYVVARDSGGTTTQSTSTYSVRVDSTPPAPFALLTPTNNSYVPSSPVTVSWASSSDAASGINHYEVWVNGVAVSPAISASVMSATVPLPTTTLFSDPITPGCANWKLGSNWFCSTDWGTNILRFVSGCCADYSADPISSFDLSNAGQAKLQFNYQVSSGSTSNYRAHFSDDDGVTWSDVLTLPQGDYSSGWPSASGSLPMAGTATAKVGFVAYDGHNMNYWMLHNILVSGIVAGPYSWYVVAQDAAGNRTTSDTWQVRYDLPPVPFSLSAPSDGTWTANSKPTVSWNATSDAGSGLAKYQLWVDAALATDNIDVAATSASPTNALTDGTHKWQIYAVDAAGAVRKSRQTWSIGIDTTPPSAFSLSSPADQSVSGIPTPTLCWKAATDAGSGVDRYQLLVDGALSRDGITSTCSSPTKTLAEGAHTWSVKSIDKTGNSRDATQTWTIYVDFNPPGPFSIIGPGNSDGYEVVNTATPTFTWQPSSSSGSGLDHYELYVSNLGRPWVCVECSIPSTSTSAIVTNPLPDGYYSWTVKAVDHVGGSTTASANSQTGTGGIQVLCTGACRVGPELGPELAPERGPEPGPELPRDGGIDAPLDSGEDDSGTAATDTSTNRDAVTVTDTGVTVVPEPQPDAASPISVADGATPDVYRADTIESRDGAVVDAMLGTVDALVITTSDASGSVVSDGGVVLADAAMGATHDAGMAGRDGGRTGTLDGAGNDGAATTTKASGGCGCVVGGGNTGPAEFWPLLVLGFLALWRDVRARRRRVDRD